MDIKSWVLGGVILAAIFLEFSSQLSYASVAVSVCKMMELEVVKKGGYQERGVATCQGLDNCTQRSDGTFYQRQPVNSYKIISTSGEPGCPETGARVSTSGAVPGEKIKASLMELTSMMPSGEVNTGRHLDKIVAADGKPLQKVYMPIVLSIIPCGKKGQSMGSGMPDSCCKGFDSVGAFDVIDGECEPLLGGYYCVECGNGICEPPEDSCNCLKDCGSK